MILMSELENSYVEFVVRMDILLSTYYSVYVLKGRRVPSCMLFGLPMELGPHTE